MKRVLEFEWDDAHGDIAGLGGIVGSFVIAQAGERVRLAVCDVTDRVNAVDHIVTTFAGVAEYEKQIAELTEENEQQKQWIKQHRAGFPPSTQIYEVGPVLEGVLRTALERLLPLPLTEAQRRDTPRKPEDPRADPKARVYDNGDVVCMNCEGVGSIKGKRCGICFGNGRIKREVAKEKPAPPTFKGLACEKCGVKVFDQEKFGKPCMSPLYGEMEVIQLPDGDTLEERPLLGVCDGKFAEIPEGVEVYDTPTQS